MPLTFNLKTRRPTKRREGMNEFDAGVLLLLARHQRRADLQRFRGRMTPQAVKVGDLLLKGKSKSRSAEAKTARAYSHLAAMVHKPELTGLGGALGRSEF